MSTNSDSHNKGIGEEGAQRPAPQMPDINAILGNNKPPRKPVNFPWRWLLVVVVAGFIIFAGYRFWPADLAVGSPAQQYTTEDVIRGSMTVTVTATGSIEPTDQVDISSELSGTVRDVYADFNDTISAGDVLLQLETDELEADIQSARARVSAAQADIAASSSDLEAAKADMERTGKLVERDVAPRQDLEDAEFKLKAMQAAKDSAEAQLSVARSDLERAQLRLTKAEIRSPIDGVVLERNVDVGQTVAASLEAPTLFVIAGNLKQMELRVDVDEADVGRVKVGQTASFTVEAFPDMSFPAEIKSIRYASEVNNDVVTYKAVLGVDNEDLLLRQGMTATAEIVADDVENALLVPNSALRFQLPSESNQPKSGQSSGPGKGRTVWLMRNDEAQPVEIVTGATDGRYTQVVEGDLRVGDRLITGTAG